jgi:hypothetical protein
MRLSDEMSKHWFGLPLQLRRRWWEETDYGQKPASKELQQAVNEVIKRLERPSDRQRT